MRGALIPLVVVAPMRVGYIRLVERRTARQVVLDRINLAHHRIPNDVSQRNKLGARRPRKPLLALRIDVNAMTPIGPRALELNRSRCRQPGLTGLTGLIPARSHETRSHFRARRRQTHATRIFGRPRHPRHPATPPPARRRPPSRSHPIPTAQPSTSLVITTLNVLN